MVAALIGFAGSSPYLLTLIRSQSELPISLGLILLLQAVQHLILIALATGLGLWLGPKVGLGARMLRQWLAGEDEALKQFRRRALPLAIGSGLGIGIAIGLLEILIFAPRLPAALQTSSPPWWQGLLAAFYGGINEELLMRLGLMTLLVWLVTKLTRQAQPNLAILWIANVLIALLFGLGHLPAVAALVPLTALVVTRTLLLNSLGSLVFGWLYWQQGLLAAMVAHFSADVMLHVIGRSLASLLG